MKLRIYRTWNWELACSPFEVRYGGDNPMKLVSTDVLQYLAEDDIWRTVEVVEEEKPKHPKEKRQLEEYERWKKTIKLSDNELTNLAELIRKA